MQYTPDHNKGLGLLDRHLCHLVLAVFISPPVLKVPRTELERDRADAC